MTHGKFLFMDPTCDFIVTRELGFLLLVSLSFLSSFSFSFCSFSKNFRLARISLPGSRPV